MRLFTSIFLCVFAATLQAAPLKVAVTHPFFAEWVEQVGGDQVEAVVVSEDDAGALKDAVIVYETGLGQEPWLDSALEKSGSQARRIVLSDGIPTMTMTEEFWTSMPLPHPNPEKMPECCRKDASDTNAAWEKLVKTVPRLQMPEQYGYDPAAVDAHLWFNPMYAQSAVLVINETLADAAPDSADTFDRNAYNALDQLGDLDGWIKSVIRNIPMDNRVLVTDGGSFRYYAREYGMAAPLDTPEYMGVTLMETPKPDGHACDCEGPKLYTDFIEGGPQTYSALMRQNTKLIADSLTPQPAS